MSVADHTAPSATGSWVATTVDSAASEDHFVCRIGEVQWKKKACCLWRVHVAALIPRLLEARADVQPCQPWLALASVGPVHVIHSSSPSCAYPPLIRCSLADRGWIP